MEYPELVGVKRSFHQSREPLLLDEYGKTCGFLHVVFLDLLD